MELANASVNLMRFVRQHQGLTTLMSVLQVKQMVNAIGVQVRIQNALQNKRSISKIKLLLETSTQQIRVICTGSPTNER